jgi:hypothetical protein
VNVFILGSPKLEEVGFFAVYVEMCGVSRYEGGVGRA